MSKIYGYAVVDKDGNLAPLGRKVYDTANAAANGFHQWTKRSPNGEYSHLKGKKLREQKDFRVIDLVAHPANNHPLLKLVIQDD